MAQERSKSRRALTGVVISAKSQNTIVVEVERTFAHARYGKFLRRKKRYMAHDAEGVAREGDRVEMSATRPMSKRKRFRLVKVLDHADLAGAALSPDKELAAAEGGES